MRDEDEGSDRNRDENRDSVDPIPTTEGTELGLTNHTRRSLLQLSAGLGALNLAPMSVVASDERPSRDDFTIREGSTITADAFGDTLAAEIATDEFASTIVDSEFRGVTEQADVFSQERQGYPRQDDGYVVMSTGDASEAPGEPASFASTWWDNGRFMEGYSPDGFDAYCVVDLEIEFEVPEEAEGIAFDYKFATEESPQFLGSEFQDFFEVQLIASGEIQNIALIDGEPVTVDVADTVANTPGGNSESPTPPFPDPPDVTYNAVTELQEIERSISQYQGEEITLRFRAGDASDGAFDSAVFLDNLRFIGEVDIDPGLERAERAFEEVEGAYDELLDSHVRSEAHFTAILYDEYGTEFLETLIDFWGIKAGEVPDGALDEETWETFDTIVETHNEHDDVELSTQRAFSLYEFYTDLNDELDEGMTLSETKTVAYEYYVGDGDNQEVFLDFGDDESFSDVLDEDFGIATELMDALESDDPDAECLDIVATAMEELAVTYRTRASDIVDAKEHHAQQLADYEGEDTFELLLQQSEGELDDVGSESVEPAIGITAAAIAVVTIGGLFAAGGAIGYAATRCTGSYGVASQIDGVEATGLSVSGPRAWGAEQIASTSNILTGLGTYIDRSDASVNAATGASEAKPQPTAAGGLTFAGGFKSGATIAGKELLLEYLELLLQCALVSDVDAEATLEMNDAEERTVGGVLQGIADRLCSVPLIPCSYEQPSIMVAEGELTIENTGDHDWKPSFGTDYRLFSGSEKFPAGYGIQIEGETDTILSPGEQETYTVEARVPKGEGLTSGRVDVDLGVSPVAEQLPSGWSDLIPVGLCETDYYALQESSDTDTFTVNDAVGVETVVDERISEGERIQTTFHVHDDSKETILELDYADEPHYSNLQVFDENGNLTGFDPSQPDGEPQEVEEIPGSEYSGLDTGETQREWVAIEEPDSTLTVEVVVPEVGTISDTLTAENGISVDSSVDATDTPELDPELSASDEVVGEHARRGDEVTASFTVSETNGDNPLGTVTLSEPEFEHSLGDSFESTLSEENLSVERDETAFIDVETTIPADAPEGEFVGTVDVVSENAGETTVDVRLRVDVTPVDFAADGVVHTDGVRDCVDEWSANRVTTETLRDVIDAWQSGDPVA